MHLESPLTGLSAYADAPVEMLRTATRDAFAKLVTEAIEQEVDFRVMAGDLYDGTWKDHDTGIYFCKEMGRLKKAKIPVYVLFGNHDAESEMTRKLQLPDNVFTFETRKLTTFRLDHLKVDCNPILVNQGLDAVDLAATDISVCKFAQKWDASARIDVSDGKTCDIGYIRWSCKA